MVAPAARGRWVIWLSFGVALLLSVIPYPYWLAWGRPEWVGLVLIYWNIALPHRVGGFSAVLVGLLLDGVTGGPVGQHALALVAVSYVCSLLFQRVRLYGTLQQAILVMGLLGVGLLVRHMLLAVTGQAPVLWLSLLPALVSAVLWPWVMAVLRWMRRAFHVI